MTLRSFIARKTLGARHRPQSPFVALISKLVMVLACFGGAAFAQSLAGDVANAVPQETVTPASVDPTALVTSGKRIYTGMCTRCHGISLVSNGIGFDLRKFPPDGRERFERSVNEGLRAMPAWKTILKPGDTDAIWAYIGSVNGWQQAEIQK